METTDQLLYRGVEKLKFEALTPKQQEKALKYMGERNLSLDSVQIVDSGKYARWGLAKKRQVLEPVLIGYTNDSWGGFRIRSIWIITEHPLV